MEKKYKITSVEEPINELEQKKAQESVEFSRCLMKFSVATSVTTLGASLGGYALASLDNIGSIVGLAFISVMTVASLRVQVKENKKLVELYNRRNKAEAEENDSKEKTKCLKK